MEQENLCVLTTPDTSTSNLAKICEPNCSETVRYRAVLTLWDKDGFDFGYVVRDGTIDHMDELLQRYPGEHIKRLGGEWRLEIGSRIEGGPLDEEGFYEIIDSQKGYGDFDSDGDVDGVDAAAQAQGGTGTSAVVFCNYYGKTDIY